MTPFAKSITLLSFGLLLCLASTCSWAKKTIPLFNAQYTLHHNSFEIGQVALSVKQLSEQHTYQLTSTTTNSGITRFFRDDEVLEVSQFNVSGNQLKAHSYLLKKDSKSEQKETRVSFNWEQMHVVNTTNKHSWNMPINGSEIDKALMQVALMLDLNTSTSSLTYQVADGGRLKQYTFTPLAREQIKVNDTLYDSIKLARKKDDKPLITTYWCATALHNLPVLIQRKKTYGLFEMRLKSATFNH